MDESRNHRCEHGYKQVCPECDPVVWGMTEPGQRVSRDEHHENKMDPLTFDSEPETPPDVLPWGNPRWSRPETTHFKISGKVATSPPGRPGHDYAFFINRSVRKKDGNWSQEEVDHARAQGERFKALFEQPPAESERCGRVHDNGRCVNVAVWVEMSALHPMGVVCNDCKSSMVDRVGQRELFRSGISFRRI